MKKILKNKKGFTMVELMVVIVIILILAAIAIPSFNRLVNEAKESAATAEARTVLMLAQLEVDKSSIDGTILTDADFTTSGAVITGEILRDTICEEAGIEDTSSVTITVDASSGKAKVAYVYDGTNTVTLPDDLN